MNVLLSNVAFPNFADGIACLVRSKVCTGYAKCVYTLPRSPAALPTTNSPNAASPQAMHFALKHGVDDPVILQQMLEILQAADQVVLADTVDKYLQVRARCGRQQSLEEAAACPNS